MDTFAMGGHRCRSFWSSCCCADPIEIGPSIAQARRDALKGTRHAQGRTLSIPRLNPTALGALETADCDVERPLGAVCKSDRRALRGSTVMAGMKLDLSMLDPVPKASSTSKQSAMEQCSLQAVDEFPLPPVADVRGRGSWELAYVFQSLAQHMRSGPVFILPHSWTRSRRRWWST